MFKRIAATMATVIAAAGITLVAPVAIAPSASAMPAVGVHQATRHCDGTMGNNVAFHGDLSASWSVTLLAVETNRYKWQFELLSGAYIGTQYRLGAYPSIDVSNAGPTGVWVGAHVGNIPGSGEPFLGDNWPAPASIGPNTSRTAGVAPAVPPVWAPVIIYSTFGAANNQLRFNFGDDKMKNNCVFYVDLGQPDAPEEVEDFPAATQTCDALPGSGALMTTSADLIYSVQRLGSSYTVGGVELDVSQDKDPSWPGGNFYLFHRLTLNAGGQTQDLFTGTGVRQVPDPAGTSADPVITSWSGSDFTPRTFTYTDGGQSAPYIEWEANAQTTATPCTKRWYLGTVYDSTGLDPDLNYTATGSHFFDDCQGGIGSVTISTQWTYDYNHEYAKLKSFSIQNGSLDRLVLNPYLTPAGGGTTAMSPQVNGTSGVYHSYDAAYNHATRTIAGGTTRVIDVNDWNVWNVIPYNLEYGAPGMNQFFASDAPSVELTLNAYKPGSGGTWVECTAAQVDLNRLVSASS